MQYESKGVDVSRWQGIINWSVLKNNINFAVIKIGGSDDGLYQDGMAQRNVVEARSNGVAIGFYVYLGGNHTIAEEVAHIQNLVHAIGGLKAGEWLALDWEETHPDEVGYMTGIVDGLARAGFPPPVIYMSLSRIRSNNWQNLVTRNCPLWVAAWGNNNSIAEAWEVPPSDEWKQWSLWQYSSTGVIAGIQTRVDLNYFNGNLQAFKKLGMNQDFNINVDQKPPAYNPPAQTSVYVVQPNDTLSGIAARYGRKWQDLWALNRDRVSNPNRIYPNQQLRIWGATVQDVVAPINTQPTTTHNYPRQHIVTNGESLSVIAARYGLPNWQVLYRANAARIGADPNLIHPGLVLDIP